MRKTITTTTFSCDACGVSVDVPAVRDQFRQLTTEKPADWVDARLGHENYELCADCFAQARDAFLGTFKRSEEAA